MGKPDHRVIGHFALPGKAARQALKHEAAAIFTPFSFSLKFATRHPMRLIFAGDRTIIQSCDQNANRAEKLGLVELVLPRD